MLRPLNGPPPVGPSSVGHGNSLLALLDTVSVRLIFLLVTVHRDQCWARAGRICMAGGRIPGSCTKFGDVAGGTTATGRRPVAQTLGGLDKLEHGQAGGNVVNAASKNCAPGTFETSEATCKPKSDTHQPTGVGRQNQLTYYSNYGPRIDVAMRQAVRASSTCPMQTAAAQGGFPYVDTEGYKAWETFSITYRTGRWRIPCFLQSWPLSFIRTSATRPFRVLRWLHPMSRLYWH